jgi:hypothetical protein
LAITQEGEGITSSFDIGKLLEEAKNSPGEIQDVNYRGSRDKNNCDFEFLKSNENNQ